MRLFTIYNEDTLPEQVTKNKLNIELLSAEIEKLGYTPKGEYSDVAEYEYNDVVFYDYKLYSMIKEDGTVVGVLPTNTEYWQVITGNIKGQTGAQGDTGPQGPAGQNGSNGADGENGVDALVFKRVYQRNGEPSTSGIIYSASPSYFSREVQQGDSFVLVYLDTATNISYLCVCHVTSTTGILFAIDDVTRVTGFKGEDGTDGANGKEALVIDRAIDFVRGIGSQQLINVQILPSNFNREAELNDDFVAILHDTTTNIDYVAQCEIQTMNETVVTSIVAIDIYRITGAQGPAGSSTPIYRHSILLSSHSNSTKVIEATFDIIDAESSHSANITAIANILNNLGYNSSNKLPASGAFGNATANEIYPIIGVYKNAIGPYVDINYMNDVANVATVSSSDITINVTVKTVRIV